MDELYTIEDMRKAYDAGISDTFDVGFSDDDDNHFKEFIENINKEKENAPNKDI